MRICVPTWSMCQRGSLAHVLACQRGLRANVPASQLFICTCQRANKRVNVPHDVLMFQTFLLQNAKGNFHTLLLYK